MTFQPILGFVSSKGLRAMMIGAFVLAPIGAGHAGEQSTPPTGTLDFSIIRKGDVIGSYHSDFTLRGKDEIEVQTRIKAAVTMGPIKLYNFEHKSVESWHDGRLIGLVSDTDDDGEVHHLEAHPAGHDLALSVDGKIVTANAAAVPSSLWNRDMLSAGRPIFDINDGQLFRTTIQCHPATVSPSSPTTTCEITGDLERTLQYNPDGVLEGLTFLADDGSQVVYRQR
jgi:hypothetical protein